MEVEEDGNGEEAHVEGVEVPVTWPIEEEIDTLAIDVVLMVLLVVVLETLLLVRGVELGDEVIGPLLFCKKCNTFTKVLGN